MTKSNHCFLIGNLGSDPVERSRGENGPIVGVTVAENVQTYDKESRTYKTVHTNWFNITAFGTIAERMKKGLKKGDRVAIQGRMKVSRYTDKSGEERTGFEIVADDVALWHMLPAAASPSATPGRRHQPPDSHATINEESLPF